MQDEQYSRLDIAFAKFLSQRTDLSEKDKLDFERLIADLSFNQSQGHSCMSLSRDEQVLVKHSGLASIVTDAEAELMPLVLEQNRLYLHRYWFYEDRLSSQIKALIKQSQGNEPCPKVLDRYFVQLIDQVDWQRNAAEKMLNVNFGIITGGPGTGKTTLIVKILAMLQEGVSESADFFNIALAAPTGKAAIRLQDAIAHSKQAIPCSEKIRQQIPEVVMTIHRLLGSKAPSPYFKHDASYPLPYDVVIIDEASMVDLALMSKLVDALKKDSRLILLGDKEQLASVESGAVLADLSQSLPEHTVELKKSYRFHSQIKALAAAINRQDVELAWQILQADEESVGLLEHNLIEYIAENYKAYLQLIKEGANVADIFHAFARFQVLCSNRHGEYGVIEINQKIELLLAQYIDVSVSGQWYTGRPVMVTQNNPGLKLYNGDIGICLQDQELGGLAVFFLTPDGQVRKITPNYLSSVETVFAMTIHKSQGSEFDQCVCVLPADMNQVLSKELIYTAVTRARHALKIYADYSVFSQAVMQKVERVGGLAEKMNV